MKANLILLLAVLLIFTGCFLSNEPSEPNLPVYEKEIVWTLETSCYIPYENPWQDGKYFYCIESNPSDCDADTSFYISKIDIENGTYVWKSNSIHNHAFSQIVKIDNKLYIMGFYDLLYCFSDENGSLLATVRLRQTENDKTRNSTVSSFLISYNHYLYWKSLKENDDTVVFYGINRFDTKKINFDIPCTEIQNTRHDVFWDLTKTDYRMLIQAIIHKDVMYIQTRAKEDLGLKSTFFALNAETGEEKWRYASDCMEGRGEHALYVVNDRLYSFEMDIACYDIHTGIPLFENYFNLKDCKKKIYAGAIDIRDCVTYHNEKFYYTTVSGIAGNIVGTPKELIKNIFCIDAKNGEIVWCDYPFYDCSLFAKPMIINGKAFFPCYDELRVYEADTGKLLGSDLSVNTPQSSTSASYNGNFIFFNLDRKNCKAILTAIKA